jgi:hypothetical protein
VWVYGLVCWHVALLWWRLQWTDLGNSLSSWEADQRVGGSYVCVRTLHAIWIARWDVRFAE